jgi:predicted dehydrogenase
MTIRFAVVGAGHLGKIHARLLSGIDGTELVAVTDPTDAARVAAAEQFQVATYASHCQVLDRVDAFIIASPTDLHAEIARDCLQAGKHVFVEKPLTTYAADAYSLVELARVKQSILQVGHVERFNPAWSAAAEVVAHPKFIEATRASHFPGRCLDVGVVMDLMIHDLDLVLSLTDAELVDVRASGIAVVSNHEDLAEARLEFACGLVAQLKASRVSLGATRTMQVFGENGYADIDFSGPRVTLVRPSREISQRTFDLTALGDPRSAKERIFAEHLRAESPTLEGRNAILDELHDFVISIQSGEQPTVSGVAGARAVETAEAILSAMRKRCWNGSHDLLTVGPHAKPADRIQRYRKSA